jgi:tetratricopeptide (TPR) repeat protein
VFHRVWICTKVGYALVAALALATLGGCASLGRSHQPAEMPAPENERRAMQYFLQAKVYESQRNYLGAIVALRSAADLDPSSPTIFAQLARNYERIPGWRIGPDGDTAWVTGDLAMAIVFARKALDLGGEQTELRYHMIRWLESTGHHRAAANELEELLTYEADNWALYSHLARVLLETGQKKRLETLFEDLLSRGDTPTEVRVNVAYIFSRRGETEQAKAVFEDVLSADPTVEDAWIGLAELELSTGNRERAIELYRQATRILPEGSLVHYELARLMVTPYDLAVLLAEEDATFLYRLGGRRIIKKKNHLARAVFERIVGLHPTTADGWLDPARFHLQRGDIAQAVVVLEKATTAMPDSLDLYLFWGTAMERAERYDDAVRAYERGIAQLPREVDLYLYLGFSLEQRELWDEAIQVYRRGLVGAGEDPELYIRLGIVHGRQERWYDAISRYRKAVQADPLNAGAFLYWGIALEKLAQWDGAIEKLARASQLDPEDTSSLFYLGSCLEQAARAREDEGFFSRAVETFKELIHKSPSDAYALNYLGYMYAEKGIHLNEAVDLLERAVSLDPDNGAFFDSLGWAHYQLGELEQAERFLAKALEQMKDHEEEEQAVIYDHAGDIAHRLGQAEKAAHHWRRALDLVPDDSEVERKLQGTIEPSPLP